jgi:hypothetical protein
MHVWEFYFLPFSVHAKGNVNLPRYSRINSTKSPAAGACNVIKARLMPQVAGVHEAVCAFCKHQCVSVVRAVEMPVFCFALFMQ